MADKSALVKLLQKLISIKSENPPGDERIIAKFVKSFLIDLGFRVKVHEFKKNRTNVFGFLRGKTTKTLILAVHLDTVPAGSGWLVPPFKGIIKENKIYGRGAADCKGNTAASLAAIKSIRDQNIELEYNLLFVATSDEETGSQYGIIPLLEHNKIIADAAIILDAQDFDIVTAQKGLLQFKVRVFGLKAHGAYPGKGINAIEISASVISELKKYKFIYNKHEFLRPPTVNIGTIVGGDKVNVVADWCEFTVDLRFLQGMNYKELILQIKRLIKNKADKFKVEIIDIQLPYEINKNNFLVKNLLLALKDNKITPKIRGSEGATVITFFKKKNIAAIATGFSNPDTMHITNEYIEIENLYKGTLVLESLLKNFDFNISN